MRVVDKMVGPLDGEQISLLDKVVELVRGPFRIGEALVLWVGRDTAETGEKISSAGEILTAKRT